MLIKRSILERIQRGEVTLQFRRWQRRTVKPGGTLKTRIGVLRIGAIRAVDPDSVSDGAARSGGFADARDFRRWLDTTSGGTLESIEVSYLGTDPSTELRLDTDLSSADLQSIAARLDRMDDRSTIGAWTARAMALIEAHPGRPAEALAREMGLEKTKLKPRIRRLKALGLTESLEVGYRLSPRGRMVFDFRGG